MSEALSHLAARLSDAARAVAAVDHRLAAAPLDPAAFGSGATGRLGQLGARLHEVWEEARRARVDEARGWVARVDEAAHVVVRSREAYAETEHDVRHALPGGER